MLIHLEVLLIPENIFLQPSTLIFKNEEDCIFVINESSLSKSILWKQLTLIVEYEYDTESQWKKICIEKAVPHIFVRLSPLPLKSLKEIKEHRSLVIEKCESVQKTFSIVISSTITPQFDLLSLLKSRSNLSLHIRNYSEILPHMHFADIVVNERTALVLVEETSFNFMGYVENLNNKILFLTLKYEVCWIVIQYSLKTLNNKENIWNFCYSCGIFKRKNSCKIKVVYTQNISEITDLIQNIVIVSSRSNTKDSNCSSFKDIFKDEMTKEECFLVSFPSINPYVANILLFETTLFQLLVMNFSEIIETFPSVPERFLKCFYSSLEKDFICDISALSNSKENLDDFQFEGSTTQQTAFVFSPILHDSNKNSDCNFESDIKEKDLEEINDVVPRLQNAQIQCNSLDKSLEELDLEYMSLKMGQAYDNFNSKSSYYSISAEQELEDIPNLKMHGVARRYENPDLFQNSRSSLFDFSIDKNIFEDSRSYEKIVKSNSIPSETPRKIRASEYFSQSKNLDAPFCLTKPVLTFKKYTKEPAKRKRSFETSEEENRSNSESGSSPVLKKSCRTQKGLSSKTVTKRDLYHPPPLINQQTTMNQPDNVAERKISENKSFFQKFLKENGGFPDFTTPNDPYLHNNKELEFIESSPNIIPLTPRTTKKLAYEGSKGQTRLVFL